MRLSADDRCDLMNLYSLSTRLISDGDVEGWADLFTPEGVFALPAIEAFGAPALEVRGTDALEDYVRQVIAGAFDPQMGLEPGTKKRYLATNIVLGPAPDDPAAAVGSAYLLLLVLTPEGPRPLASGVYSDLFRKTSRGWKIERRLLNPDVP